MTDLERFFVQLVRNVAAGDRTRLGKPLLLVDIRNSILPYRANRRELQLESSEDYELILMRLCTGEAGFARTGPDEVHDEFKKELESPNPDLTIVQRHENAVVHLDPKSVAKVLDPNPELAYAPQEHRSPAKETKPAPESKPKRGSREPEPASRCSRCGGALPTGRVVNFCPQCGQDLTRTRCPECKTELEPGWLHCVNCGAAVGER
jgi:double zinc ribbon protein